MCLTPSLILCSLPLLQMEVSEKFGLLQTGAGRIDQLIITYTLYRDYLGECNKQTAFEMLDFFYENGGNFIDTANK